MDYCTVYQMSQSIVNMLLKTILNTIARSTAGNCRDAASRVVGRYKSEPAVDDAASPFLVEFFMVQGTGFQCMAYRNSDGKWRGAFDNRELPGAIHVLE
jgi:hypothetical protein